jgi:hypothetical protein
MTKGLILAFRRILHRTMLLLVSFFPGLKWALMFRMDLRRSSAKGNAKEIIWAFRKGFFLETVQQCRINSKNVNEYISNRQYLELHPINRQYSKIIDNKLFLPYLLKEFPEIIPKYYYFIEHGKLHPVDICDEFEQNPLDICRRDKFLALKACSRERGDGFYRLEFKFDTFYLNDKVIEPSDFNKFVAGLDQYIISEYVNQHRYAYEINPWCANTIRFLCLRDENESGFFIARAYHRFGSQNKYVDNIGADGAGLMVYVDLDTGKLKDNGLIKTINNGIKIGSILHHPETKAPIAGLNIPNWENVKSKLIKVLNRISFIKYAGIDLVVTEDGFKILEMNSLPAAIDLQFEEGLLKDSRIKSFFLKQKNSEA